MRESDRRRLKSVAVAEFWIRRTRRGTSGSALLEHEGELVPAEPEAVTVL